LSGWLLGEGEIPEEASHLLASHIITESGPYDLVSQWCVCVCVLWVASIMI